MNWPPTDLETLMYLNHVNKKQFLDHYQSFIKRLNTRKETWNKDVQSLPSFYDFMKEDVYEEH